MDFIIHRKNFQRGVSVIADKSEKSIGIQFTTSQDPRLLAHKQRQTDKAKPRVKREHIDDIIVVSIPLKEFMNAHNEWQKVKTPGGPDKLWTDEIRAQIFREVMKKVFTPDEIEQEWSMISGEKTELPMAA
jgi:hypothetical protein